MSQPIDGFTLGQALAKEGLIPKECAEVSLHMPVDGLVQLHYVVNVLSEDFPKLARAIASVGSLDWDKAWTHFSEVKKQYEELLGAPGVATGPALLVVFEPLQLRYEGGERTQTLFDELMSVE